VVAGSRIWILVHLALLVAFVLMLSGLVAVHDSIRGGPPGALAFAKTGRSTMATARRRQALDDLAAVGCRTLALDVTDEDSMVNAVREAASLPGGIFALVNNAGYAEIGPLEELAIEDVRRQFETNVIGTLRMCQLVLPGMRRRGRGRIINVSTMGGLLAMQGGGYYASKHALEALSDSLRAEVAPFGIEVVVIEPGLVWSRFNERARQSKALVSGGGPYDELKRALATRAFSEDPGVPRFVGATPERVAAVIVGAVEADRPRPRYRVTAMAHLLPAVRRLLPDRWWDRATRRMLGLSNSKADGRS
jgi:NAD(P)-dependent dehydrogenase (short-subunit alcohol dehydrogenase family)